MKAFPFPEGIYIAGTLCVRAWRQPCEKWIMEENCATTVLRVAADIPDRLLECGAGGGGGRVTSRKWHWPRDGARLFSDIYKSILRMRHFSVLGIPGYGTAEKLKFRLTLRDRRNLRFSPNPTRIPRAQRRWGRYTQINTVFFGPVQIGISVYH